MSGFEWWFAALALLAGLFVAWPLLAGKGRQSTPDRAEAAPMQGSEYSERLAFNDALYLEQLQDLDQQLGSGTITGPRYEKLKQELDSQHQQDNALEVATDSGRKFRRAPWLVGAMAVALPLLAFVLYNSWGFADDWRIQELNNALSRQQQRGADLETLRALSQDLYENLEDRLEEAPDNLNNRFLLARTAVELGDFREALAAYRYILGRQPNSPQVMGEMAQVLFMAAGNRFTPEVRLLFDRALEMDPDNSDLLGFAGIGAYQSGKYRLAIDYWETGLNTLTAGDPRRQTWQRAIGEAKRQLGDEPSQAEAAGSESVATSEGSTMAASALEISVTLGEAVDAQPGDKVFIYARAWDGAKMPLAMQQVTVADLPMTVELDESMSMMPGMTMSRFPQLEVVARISSSGVADARSGDWQASAGPVDSASPDKSIKLVIDSQLP